MSSFLSSHEKSAEIIDFIKSRKWTPNQLREQIPFFFPRLVSNFGIASEIDALAFPDTFVQGNHWAFSCEFPKKGTYIRMGERDYYVIWCGAYTCALSLIESFELPKL